MFFHPYNCNTGLVVKDSFVILADIMVLPRFHDTRRYHSTPRFHDIRRYHGTPRFLDIILTKYQMNSRERPRQRPRQVLCRLMTNFFYSYLRSDIFFIDFFPGSSRCA